MDREMTQEQREAYEKKLGMYYDAQGRLKQYPSKRPLREIALSKIAAHFEKDKIYTEKEVNEIIRQSISFSDVELIRREMFEKKLIGRLRDGSQYWKECEARGAAEPLLQYRNLCRSGACEPFAK